LEEKGEADRSAAAVGEDGREERKDLEVGSGGENELGDGRGSRG
jgi:hypothetical protein